MLISLNADKESFKEVKFKAGLNILLAERTKESTKKDSRNGLGKTSMIEIIHFLTGGNITKTLKKSELEDWTFTLKLKLIGKEYSISRNTKNQKFVVIDGDCSDWVILPEKDGKGNQIMSNANWKSILGVLMFGMQKEYPDYKYSPTFRSCFAYFARLDENGGFLSHDIQYKQQKEWDIQLSNSYLMELDWTYASKWQILKDRKKILNQLKTEAESGLLKDMHGSIGELEAEKIRLENDVNTQQEQLTSFKVHPQYDKIETDANKITKLIHEHVNENITDKNLLENYKDSLNNEKEADSDHIEKVYKEAGILIPNLVKKKLDDVKKFHENIVINRKDFLNSELLEIQARITKRQSDIRILSEKRTDLLNILRKHKALDEYTALQQRNTQMISELEDIKRKIDNLKKFEDGKSNLKVDLELIQQKARISLDERKEFKERAINLFNKNSQNLYNSPGILSIDVTSTGYKFGVDIKREGSHGVKNMKIYCYDLMRVQLLSKWKNSPGFLIHDSIIFADVDERQIALALELGQKESLANNFQYICTFNSDNVPIKDFSDDFKFEDHIILKLTDADEKGGLFGCRFN
ncbi:MAG: DUF2326 domain-containing protein [Nanoarchaeota archaeon]|nr:DUF2326 domain-containing protein [Nanoarchaeota archaeon]